MTACPTCGGLVDEDTLNAEPFDQHVRAATKLFRDVGFTLAAMEFPRSAASLSKLKALNRVPDDWKEPVGWRYHPNRYLAALDTIK